MSRRTLPRRNPALVLTFVTLILSAAIPAAAQDAKYVKLVHAETGKVLAVAGDSEDSYARAVLAADEAGEARQWRLERDGDHFKAVNRKSGKVLDVEGAASDEGRAVIQFDDKGAEAGNENQRWAWAGDGAERRLKSKHSGLVLDVDGEGKAVQKAADERARGQLWKVVEVKE